MGQTRSLSKAQHRLQVDLHMSLVCIVTIEPASSSSLGALIEVGSLNPRIVGGRVFHLEGPQELNDLHPNLEDV